jgi:hypothetical protein
MFVCVGCNNPTDLRLIFALISMAHLEEDPQQVHHQDMIKVMVVPKADMVEGLDMEAAALEASPSLLLLVPPLAQILNCGIGSCQSIPTDPAASLLQNFRKRLSMEIGLLSTLIPLSC